MKKREMLTSGSAEANKIIAPISQAIGRMAVSDGILWDAYTSLSLYDNCGNETNVLPADYWKQVNANLYADEMLQYLFHYQSTVL